MILKPFQPLSLRYVELPPAKEDPQYYNEIVSATKNTCFEPIFAKWTSFAEMELDSTHRSFELECVDAMRKEYGNWPQIYEPKPSWHHADLQYPRSFRENTTVRIHRLLEKLSQVKAKHITEIERRKLQERLTTPVNPYYAPFMPIEVLRELVAEQDLNTQHHATTLTS